ncbi:MAG: DUF4168 domain-containing protein [Rhodobacteraceae bacterium]|nr:MAG: DUF4168 domain-containing protein [Paracoccaceae bacterium]
MFRPMIAAAALSAGLAFGAAAQDFDDAQVEAFATAALAVQDIRETYAPRLEAAGDPDEQAVLMDQATAEMIAAIEAIPQIDVDGYNAIATATATDPELASRVVETMESMDR